MKLMVTLSFFILLVAPFSSRAQLEAAVWPIDSGKQITFQSGSFQFTDIEGSPNVNTTICDKDGNLLLMTNGDTVWNGNNEILINGTGLIEDGYFRYFGSRNPIFVPHPGKDGYYILIYEYAHKVLIEILNYYTIKDINGNDSIEIVEHTGEFRVGYKDHKLVYAIIDSKADGGRGKVITKQNFILSDYGLYTIAGYCDNSYYWMAISYSIPYIDRVTREKKSTLLFYKIDEEGISKNPEKMHISGNIYGLKFSPNGDRLCFQQNYRNEDDFSSDDYISIADFNFLTGELYNFREIKVTYGIIGNCYEFSPDGRFLYFTDNGILWQADIRYSDKLNLKNSIDTIYDHSFSYNFLRLKLAPDGKIYVLYYNTWDEKQGLGAINYPNIKGKGCKLKLRQVIFEYNNIDINFPEFVTTFNRDKSLDVIDEHYADAGPDKEICYLSETDIGAGNFQPDNIYQWFPDQYIKDPFSSQVTFSSPLFYGSPKTYSFILRASDKNCWLNFDSTKVTVMPKPYKTLVVGTRSVCPYVEEVDYWVAKNDDGNSFLWSVNGGDIIGDYAADSIKITWYEANPDATVNLVTTTDLGCKSDVTKFPVNVTTELEPEIPEGYDTLCIADAKDVVYTTKNTNGSVYEWIVDGGVILDGQGSNEIHVEWKHDGQNKIYVRETSVTTGASCYGESEPLPVGILNDTLNIDISYVTYNLDNKVEVHYESDKFNIHKHMLIQHNEEVNSGFIDEYYPRNSGLQGYYIYLANPEETGSQIISLEVVNRCDEIFTSGKQQTIVLEGEIYPEQTTISLRWNQNQFWSRDRIKHEIWHSVDSKENWKLAATIDKRTTFNYEYPDIALNHYIRVKEVNEDKNLESWSNVLEFQVSDILKVPTVFTPNGDGINDTWEIWNHDNYIFEGVTVYNKSGKAVYQCGRAFTPWDGKINGKVYQGTYFYELKFQNLGTRYGQVTVLQ